MQKWAEIKIDNWPEVMKQFAAECPYYAKDGEPDGYHMAGTALKQGFKEITAKNLPDVLEALRKYAVHRNAEKVVRRTWRDQKRLRKRAGLE